ncbi:hypothetical protein ACIQEY_01660 [Streptomyces parvus]|uniref:hypothetical protein n=1 Tax=Streptomyces parvus TaxID=66428 RepID=UPI003632811B
MADEHYEWLDKDAAERLLRGEPVVPVGDEARTDAFRLAEALGAARAGLRAPAGELPGEDAVLAAFRQAGHGSGADRLAGRAAVPGRPGQLHTVHLGSAPAAPARRPRWSRPVRFGLVASLAGCALGGVAVAAGTGVFTGTFGGQGSPTPASSVSAGMTPGPLISSDSVDDPSAPASPAQPETSSSPTARESGGPEETDGARTAGPGRESGTGRPDTPDRPGDNGRDETTGGGTGQDDRPGGSGGDTDSGNWYEKSVKACKAFRAGTLDDRSRRQLIEFAKGEKNLERFCDRLLDGNGGNGGSGGSGGGHGDDDDDDGGQNGPGDGGSLPPVSFHPVPRAAAAPEDGAGAGADAEVPPLPVSSGAATVLTR